MSYIDIYNTDKKYQIIYADPPWSYKDKLNLQREGSECHYKTMSMQEIYKFGEAVKKISNEDCILFLWVTNPLMKEIIKKEIIEAWGFNYKTIAFCWIKTNPKAGTIFKGIGRWVMGNSENVLLCTKGKPKRINKDISQIIMAPRGKHSEKPPETRDRIIRLMGNIPRIELFARQAVEGWDCWGNEAPKDPEEV